MLEAFLISTGAVAVGEIGDKTQLLTLLLTARFKKPVPIIAGIFFSTLANHAAAGYLGNLISRQIGPDTLRIILGVSFLAVAAWALKPDKIEDEPSGLTGHGVFLITFAAFFLAEMGDKTQVATVMLAARFPSLTAVVMGTTLGMMLANLPVVFISEKAAEKIPLKAVRISASVIFGILGIWTLAGQYFSH